MKVNVELEVPQSCLDCMFHHTVYGNDDLMFGDPEYNYFIGYTCRRDPNKEPQENAEMLRYENENCPFKQYMPKVRKPASDKQKALVAAMEQFDELPRCEDKETAQGCFLYIRDNMEKYQELCRKQQELEREWDLETEEDYDYYALCDEPF